MSIRIIAGTYKGRKIDAPNSARPTLDRVRENIFNILSMRISGSKFLDMFGGSGAIGIEALSRGADVTICEMDKMAYKTITSNLEKIGARVRVIFGDSKHYIRQTNDKYDIIYIDAPYEMKCLDEILTIVSERDILSDNGLVVYEHSSDYSVREVIEGFTIRDERKYGFATITFVEKSV